MQKLRIGPDFDDPEVRIARHRQKVIEHMKAYTSEDDFKWWLTGLLYQELWAEDEFEKVSSYLRGRQEP